MFTFLCFCARVNYDIQIVAGKNRKQGQSLLILTMHFHSSFVKTSMPKKASPTSRKTCKKYLMTECSEL